MNLGKNIYKYRTQKNMSQGDLAEALDVSRQSVSKWENNNAVPELDKLMKIAELFGISLDELVGKESAAQSGIPQSDPAPKSAGTAQKVTGIILVCFGGLILLMALQATNLSALRSCLLLAAPFFLCGTIFLKVKHHPGFWCLFALYLLIWIPMGILSPNYIRLGFAKVIQLLHILWGAALSYHGIHHKKRGTFLQSDRRAILFFSLLVATIGITFLFLLFPGLLPTPGLLRF